MSVSNIYSRIPVGVTPAHEKRAMKIKERNKERKKRRPYKNFFDDSKDFVWLQ